MDPKLTVPDLSVAYMMSMNEREYACLILLFPSQHATKPEVQAEHKLGKVSIFGNIETPRDQIAVLREVADKIEVVENELSEKFEEQKQRKVPRKQ